MKVNGELKSTYLEACKTANIPSASAATGRILYDVDTSKVIISNGTTWSTIDTGQNELAWKRKKLDNGDEVIVSNSNVDVIGFTGLTTGTYKFTANLTVWVEDNASIEFRFKKDGSIEADTSFLYSIGNETESAWSVYIRDYKTICLTHMFTVASGTEDIMLIAKTASSGEDAIISPDSYTNDAESTHPKNGSNAYLEMLPGNTAAGSWS